MNELSEQEREEVISAIRAGRTLPARYRASLFEDAFEAELIWPGKTSEVERTVLPFQSIEHIDEPRSGTVHRPDLFSVDSSSGRQSGGWTNKLIWGDNKLILSSLANGPLRDEIEAAGGLKLVYIDPPFDVGADFSVEVEIGGESLQKQPSTVEEFAYRDTWGQGKDSYLAMFSERLQLIESLLSNDGVIVVHCDWRLVHLLRIVLDEIFGSANFINELIWRYGKMSNATRRFPQNHDSLLVYAKGPNYTFNPVRESDSEYKNRFIRFVDGNKLRYGAVRESSDKLILGRVKKVQSALGRPLEDDDVLFDFDIEFKTQDDVFYDISIVKGNAAEKLGYPTQKPEGLLDRVVSAFSVDGDLVADFFCGSGTTLAVAERLGRKWIGVDLGRFAVHTTRKRIISLQRELASENKAYRAFEILNLGSYERQYFSGIDMSLPADQREAASLQRREQFLSLILNAYGGKRSEQFAEFHGTKDNAAVFVGPLDAPVTQQDVLKVMAGARVHGITRVDVLGFEFEMGIKPAMSDEAKEEGVTLTLQYIPNDVFDKRAIAKGEVKFFNVGYLEVKPKQTKDGSVTVELEDFGVFYAQDDADSAAAGLKNSQSKVIIDNGQVVRVTKDKKGIVKKEVLTESWQDWIDYWAVDFDFQSQKEIIAVVEGEETKEIWTGRYIFENEWQDFRVRGDRSLRTVSDPHTYDTPGEYKIAVKVVDVFGNDTTKVVKVKVK